MRTAKAMPASSASRRSGNSGAPLIILGFIFIGFFALGLMTQLETNEAWLDSAVSVNVFRPNWEVFIQPLGLFLGWFDPNMFMAVFFGWFIEVLYLGLMFVGVEVAHYIIHMSGRVLGYIFEIIGLGGVVFNWYTDYQYGNIDLGQGSHIIGQGGHIAFAFVTAIVVGYFGRIGLYLLRLGWSQA